MAEMAENGGAWRGNRWRIMAWSIAAGLLLLPLIAMRFTDGVNWSASDFVFAGGMIVGTGLVFEMAVRTTRNPAYRAGAGVALATAFMLVWATLAVGFIGDEGNPANLMLGGVLAVGIVGAVIARFRPRGMARALKATAIAQALVGVIALIAGMDLPIGPTIVFILLWQGSAWLFDKSAQERDLAAV